jgi:hypothetical protein
MAGARECRFLSRTGLILGLFLLCAHSVADAAPISLAAPQTRARARAASLANATPLIQGKSLAWWDQYYANALANRRTQGIQVPQVFRKSLRGITLGNALPDTPLVQYLQWRRSLNPARFDANHPSLARAVGGVVIVAPTDPPVIPINPNPGTVQPPPVIGPEIPEPSTLLIAATLAGLGIWFRRSHSAPRRS